MLIGDARVRDRITLGAISRVFDLYEEVKTLESTRKLKSILQVRDNLRTIISLLTEMPKKSVKRRHLKRFYEYVEAAGLMQKGQKKGSKKKLLEIIAWAGARGKMSVGQVLEGFTAPELGAYIRELQSEQIEHSLSKIKAAHFPTEFMREIRKGMNRLERQRKEIDRPKYEVEAPDPGGFNVTSFKAGIGQPH